MASAISGNNSSQELWSLGELGYYRLDRPIRPLGRVLLWTVWSSILDLYPYRVEVLFQDAAGKLSTVIADELPRDADSAQYPFPSELGRR